MPKLDGWYLLSHWGIPKVKAGPEPFFMGGIVSEDEQGRFDDGTPIYTSKVIKFDPENNLAVTKSGTHYRLGNASVDYLASLESHTAKLTDFTK